MAKFGWMEGICRHGQADWCQFRRDRLLLSPSRI